MNRLRYVFGLAAAAIIATTAWMWAAQQGTSKRSELAADLPSGALLTIESPDFAHVLHDWDNSAEQGAFVHSASFSAFGNSRLWARLTDAEQEFAGTADADFDTKFLRSVAGTDSVFAWYDIGTLEFLYMSRLSPGQMQGVQLLARRGKFSERKAGDTVFYVRTGTKIDQADGAGQQRTVAFAQRGDTLLLATREDLIANALLRMQGRRDTQGVVDEGWYQFALKAATQPAGELHMVLDLQRITKTPQFRTYWVQRNITDTRRFRAAVVDLYREADCFREERTLLPMQTTLLKTASPDTAALEGMVPQRAGVYRISAMPSAGDAMTELSDKVLERTAVASAYDETAPDADLSVPEAGDTRDLETRIDSPQPVDEAADAWLNPLRAVLAAEPLTAMMSVSRTDMPGANDVFFPIHSAVVLSRTRPWDEKELASVVLGALQQKFIVGTAGLGWKRQRKGGISYMETTGAQHIAIAIRGNTAVVSTDPALLAEILTRSLQPQEAPAKNFTSIVGFRHTQEQAAFLRLAVALDAVPASAEGTAAVVQASTTQTSANGDAPVPATSFFRDNVGSLSRTFSALDTEHFSEQTTNGLVRQTVVYTWKPAAVEH